MKIVWLQCSCFTKQILLWYKLHAVKKSFPCSCPFIFYYTCNCCWWMD